MSTPKKNAKPNPEEVTAAIQSLIAQGKKDGMIRAADLNTQLERLGLPQDKIEEVYDRLEAMNIQVLGPELELDLGDDLDLGDGDDGDEGDLQGVGDDDTAAGQALGGGRADVVRVQLFDHGGAGDAAGEGHHVHGQGDGGEDHLLDAVALIDGGEPLQFQGKDQHQHQGGQKDRGGHEDQRQG